jgi:O-antigen/teichoic acid export membrane protein
MLPAPSMSAPSLRRNFAWVFAGSLILALSQWGVQIALTKLAANGVVGAANLGTWNLGLAVTGPVFVFFMVKLRTLQATDQRGQFQWASYSMVRAGGMASALGVTLIVVLALYRDATATVIVGAGLSKAFEGGSDLVYGQLQRIEAMRAIAVSQAGRGLTSVAGAITTFALTHSISGAALTMAAVYGLWMVSDLVLLRRTLAIGRPRFSPEVVSLLRMCAPLGLVTAIGSLQLNIPRYFLESNTSRAELGVWSAMQTVLLFGGLMITSIANAALARLATYVANEQWPLFARLVRNLVLIGIGIAGLGVLGSLLLGHWVLRLLYSDVIAAQHDVLVWIAAVNGLSWTYMFLGTALDAMRRYRVQPWIHGTSCVVIAIASAALVPRWHLRGAAWAMLIGVGVESIMYSVAVAVPLRAEMRRHRS